MVSINYAVFKIPHEYTPLLEGHLPSLKKAFPEVQCYLESSKYSYFCVLALMESVSSEEQTRSPKIRNLLKQLREIVPEHVRPSWVHTNILHAKDLAKIVSSLEQT